MSAGKLDWRDRLVAAVLASGYIALLLRSVRGLGYARDEGFYFQAAHSYTGWFTLLGKSVKAAFERKAIDGAWAVNHEHPGLIKSLFALSNLWLQQKWHLFSMEGTSFRFPAMVLAGLGLGLVYLWGTAARGRTAGLCAALLFGALPRFFFQAHLACFDAPIVTIWMLCAFCWWRALDRGGYAWPLLTGVAFGLALDTKHNSWFLPILCVTHAVAIQVEARLRGRGDARLAGQRSLAALASMALLGPAVFYALWPWIWHDTRARLAEYASFHLNHEYYNMEFLGRTYWTPPMPRAYPWVMTAATVPVVTLALAALGIAIRGRARFGDLLARGVARIRRRTLPHPPRPPRVDLASTDLFWLMAIGISYGAWTSPKTPIFGGTKHWMTAYPFLCLFAGAAFAEVVRLVRAALGRGALRARLRRLARGPLPEMSIAAAVLAAPVTETIRSHPWGLSSYTPLVGGAAGAATLGLNRTFWGYTTGAVTDYLNEAAPRGATVYVHDTAWPSWEMLQRDGRLRKDIRGVGTAAGADFALYHHEQHMLGQEYQAWIAFGTDRPSHIDGLDGVPVIWIYRRPTGGAP